LFTDPKVMMTFVVKRGTGSVRMRQFSGTMRLSRKQVAQILLLGMCQEQTLNKLTLLKGTPNGMCVVCKTTKTMWVALPDICPFPWCLCDPWQPCSSLSIYFAMPSISDGELLQVLC
jgi:hypothetical protein